jgi:hypothetical protein
MCVDDESIDDDPKLWWACQAIIYYMCQRQRCPSAYSCGLVRLQGAPPGCLCHTLTYSWYQTMVKTNVTVTPVVKVKDITIWQPVISSLRAKYPWSHILENRQSTWPAICVTFIGQRGTRYKANYPGAASPRGISRRARRPPRTAGSTAGPTPITRGYWGAPRSAIRIKLSDASRDRPLSPLSSYLLSDISIKSLSRAINPTVECRATLDIEFFAYDARAIA